MSHKPAIFHCHFAGCMKGCKSAGGLTQHQSTCQFNPANQYRFSPMSHTPSPFPSGDGPATPPHTPQHQPLPAEVPPTPSHTTPRHSRWETKGRSGVYVRKHPYLDGETCFKTFIIIKKEKGIYIL
jgi:hypothetical protein